MKSKILFVAIMLATTMVARAQSQQDIQLADQYFSNSEFDKAVILYEKLWNKNPGNPQFYQNYLVCLTELKQYDDAEKMIRKQIKKFGDDLSLYVDLGSVYQKQGNEKAATGQYEEAISKITPNMPQITKLANRFLTGSLIDYSIQTYHKGRKIFNAEGSDLFLPDLAGLYNKKGDVREAVKTYLDILETDPNQKEYVQGQLQPLLENNQYGKELQAELYSRIQKKPDAGQLADLLVWFFVQKKDFTSAFQQVKALDKRNKEDGNRVFQFAQSAFDEGYYDAGLNAYHYIITEKGKASYLYLPARTSELTTEKTRITILHNYTNEELKQLESKYQAYLDEFGKVPQTLVTMRDYANLEAKFLHNPDKAISILQEAIAISTNDRKLNGYLKLDLGDDQLIQGQVWEAMLLYGQVDKSFHDEPIGEEARFKNAKLSFYMGDFEWSQTQLEPCVVIFFFHGL